MEVKKQTINTSEREEIKCLCFKIIKPSVKGLFPESDFYSINEDLSSEKC